MDTPGFFADWLERTGNTLESGTKSTAVIYDGRVVGHIIQHRDLVHDTDFVYCGWDLSPDYWGRGIMTQSLKAHFCQPFNDQTLDRIVADCFHDNDRCKRLMQRLGFSHVPIPMLDRLRSAFNNYSLRWVDRHELTRDALSISPPHNIYMASFVK